MIRRHFLSMMACTLGALALSAATACAGGNKVDYWMSPELPEPPIPTLSEMVVVLPVHVDTQGNAEALASMVEEGFFSQLRHATQAEGGAELAPALEEIGLGKLTPRFAAAMMDAAYNENSEILTPEYSDVTHALNPLFRLIETTYQGKPFRWVAVVRMEEVPSAKDMQALFEIQAGFYDMQRNTLAAVVKFQRYAEAEKLGITARMAGVDAAARLTRDESIPTEAPPEEAPTEPQGPN